MINRNMEQHSLTSEEERIIAVYRSLRPRDTMKVSKNQDGGMVTITTEHHEAVKVDRPLVPRTG
jgi:hypothetical protein